ncbi:MAG: NADH-quinone oxidoreductase subunit H [Candidatus Margulisiibacteriota bacterium]|jgi:formate hydrogenlyase subunit 4
MYLVIVILKFCLFIILAPLVSGFITYLKNNLRMRKGQSILQPYFNLQKLFNKDEVISVTASWIFKTAPFVVIASMLTGLVVVCWPGDLLILIFVFALGRFFIALAGLDTGSAFGGMGSSREMFISSLAEPSAGLAVFALALQYGSTSVNALTGTHAFSFATLAAAATLFIVILAETSRIPVDNQETHLELTMIHEAMVLEYSGRRLALIEMASYIKQMTWLVLLSLILLPVLLHDLFWTLVMIAVFSALIAVVEVSISKMRLFRVADLFGLAFGLAAAALVCAMLGV